VTTPVPSTSRLDDVIVRTRFVSPTLRQHVVPRPRLNAALDRVLDHPLTVLRAEAGYGKTTAIASWLLGGSHPHVWYSVADVEPDPRLFLLHLVEALATTLPGIEVDARERLERGDRSPRSWTTVIDRVSNELLDRLHADTVLVLDDYDGVNRPEINAIVERLVETMPPKLHVVVTARTMPSLRARARWRASSELLEIGRSELAFTVEEVESLLGRRLEQPISRDVARSVAAETEGWPIALQMLSDSLGNANPWALDTLLQRIPGPAELLFDYLAEEVFLRQTPDIRRFLAESACLRRLDADACDFALESTDSASVLRFLEQGSLFVSRDGGYRYHALFADFLHRRSDITPQRREHIHRRAAMFFAEHGNEEEAVHHHLAAGDHRAAADVLARIAARMTATGRHRALAAWLDQLPDDELERSGELLLARAEASRLASRYPEALALYERAAARFRAVNDPHGEIRTLRAQALVYLDTVQPSRAEPLLRQALKKSRGDRLERAALYALLAENELNSGHLRYAERMFGAAHRVMHPSEPAARDPRLDLRRGRFAEARQLIEQHLYADRRSLQLARAPRSHREATAVLAWIELLTGDAPAARQHAAEALEVGHILGSPVIECLSLGRLGLSWLAGRDYDITRARGYCDDALRTAERFGVPRFRVEPLLGLTVIAGLERKRGDAELAAREALAILRDAGDLYVVSVLELALGAALTLASAHEAESHLAVAERQAAECGDAFVPTLAALWLAVLYSGDGATAPAHDAFIRALGGAGRNGYDYVFHGTPLLAPKHSDLWRALLRRAHEDEAVGPLARRLSQQFVPPQTPTSTAVVAALDGQTTAPLFIQTLGPFRAWRRGQEIERRAWPREKALHLLQLLVCHRGHGLHRDRILEMLWPDSSASTAATGLRVALSALRNALEPDRESGSDGRFVRRDGDTIRLAMDSGLRVDVDDFTRLLKAARAAESGSRETMVATYEAALGLYRGDFLEEHLYAAWAEEERQLRRSEFLSAAERFATLLLRAGDSERGARLAETMLQQDPLWEGAYALLMEAHWQQGNRALAVRAYNRCKKRLRDALGVAPSARITTLLERIARPESGSTVSSR
jgi:LuxR family maltose regulon positive regulatory protein